MHRKIRVVIADDHPVVRIGVRNMLSEGDGFEVVGEATDGDEAITQTLELQPDILQSHAFDRMIRNSHDQHTGLRTDAGGEDVGDEYIS